MPRKYTPEEIKKLEKEHNEIIRKRKEQGLSNSKPDYSMVEEIAMGYQRN